MLSGLDQSIDSTEMPIAVEYEKFFEQFNELAANKITGFDDFFSIYGPIAQRIRDEQKRIQAKLKSSAQRFNIFGALQIHENEVLTSRFLAYLLNPRGHHDQGATFLLSFMDWVLGEVKPAGIAELARVTPERWIGIYGRVDIAIEFPDGQIVIVENKINASERSKQIEDYQSWLSLQKENGHAIIFLTPNGGAPVSAKSDGVRVKPLSYRNLAEWLSTIPVPPRMAIVIQQFRESVISKKEDTNGFRG